MIHPQRFYPHKNIASHLIGYVGIVQEEWTKLPEEKRSSSQVVGHSGIELLKNDHMIGLDGGNAHLGENFEHPLFHRLAVIADRFFGTDSSRQTAS